MWQVQLRALGERDKVMRYRQYWPPNSHLTHPCSHLRYHRDRERAVGLAIIEFSSKSLTSQWHRRVERGTMPMKLAGRSE
jgi:hypothetical protein